MEKLCVVMPVYNEQDAIGPVLDKWAAELDELGIDYVIRPYNDGSKDNSLAVMKSVAEHLPRIEVRDKLNGGHGNTILTGYRDAAADGFDWVFQVDSDDEMGPEKFGELWLKRGQYDFLVGIRAGRVQQLPRKIISFVSRLCVRMFYGKSVWDVNTPYRLMRVSAFKDFYQSIPLATFAPNVILSGLAARHKLRCYEIRVPQHDRTTGEVSIKKWKLLKAAIRSFTQTIMFSFYPMRIWSLIAVAGLFAVSITFFASNPFANSTPTDSAVFLYVGDSIHHGLVPYRDVFDHKGPLLYFINYLATGCGSSLMRLWLLESISWLIAFTLVFRFVRRWFAKVNPLFVLFPFTALFFGFQMGHSGNLTESWSVPLIVFVLLSLLDAILSEKILSNRRCAAIGACVAGLLLLRPNNAAVAFVAALYWVCEIWRVGRFALFCRKLLCAVLGSALVSAPFLVWYGNKGALADMWNCSVLFNLIYMSGKGCWNNKYLMGFGFIALNVLCLFRATGVLRKALMYNLCFQVLAFGVILIHPGMLQYFVPCVPASIFAIACFVHLYKTKVIALMMIVVSCGFLPVCFLRANFDVSEYLKFTRGGGVCSLLDFREGHEMIPLYDFLRDRIKDGDSVLVVGNACEVYRRLGVWTNCKYPYQHPVFKLSNKINIEIKRYIESKDSKWVIAQDDQCKRAFLPSINVGYDLVGQKGSYSLYRRKGLFE